MLTWIISHAYEEFGTIIGLALAVASAMFRFTAHHRPEPAYWLPAVLNAIIAVPIYDICRRLKEELEDDSDSAQDFNWGIYGGTCFTGSIKR